MTEGKQRDEGANGREARLAQALRANLRRRKTPASPAPAQKPQETSSD